MNAPLNMELVRRRQQERTVRSFHIDLLAHVEEAMRCYLRGKPEGTYEAIRACQRALEERITAEASHAVTGGKAA